MNYLFVFIEEREKREERTMKGKCQDPRPDPLSLLSTQFAENMGCALIKNKCQKP